MGMCGQEVPTAAVSKEGGLAATATPQVSKATVTPHPVRGQVPPSPLQGKKRPVGFLTQLLGQDAELQKSGRLSRLGVRWGAP